MGEMDGALFYCSRMLSQEEVDIVLPKREPNRGLLHLSVTYPIFLAFVGNESGQRIEQ